MRHLDLCHNGCPGRAIFRCRGVTGANGTDRMDSLFSHSDARGCTATAHATNNVGHLSVKGAHLAQRLPNPKNNCIYPHNAIAAMADPLSIAAGVVGLLATAGKVCVLLSGFISSVSDAPQLAHAALLRVNELSFTLEMVSSLLQRLDAVPAGRRDMVRLDHLVLVFTQCVLTLSEVESLLKRVTGSSFNRLRWNLAEKKVGRSIEILEKHQSTIVLMLNVLQWYGIPLPHLSSG
jgi:hypothetical protein